MPRGDGDNVACDGNDGRTEATRPLGRRRDHFVDAMLLVPSRAEREGAQ